MTIHDVSRAVYEQTRDFFKHTAVMKSGNKRYGPGAPVDPLKYQWRATGRHIAKGVPVHLVGIDDPGDHAFLLAGYVPPSMGLVPYLTSSSMPLRTFCHEMPEIAESYVVDVWAGIFCPTSEYAHEFPRKMVKWGAQWKQVQVDGAWRDPATVGYISSVLNSTFYLFDPYQPL
jgi:hypothetical protein